MHKGIEISPHELGETGQHFHIGRAIIIQQALTYGQTYDIHYLDLIIHHPSGDFGIAGHLDNEQLTPAERIHGQYATDDGLKLNAIAIQSRQGMVTRPVSNPPK